MYICMYMYIHTYVQFLPQLSGPIFYESIQAFNYYRLRTGKMMIY